MNDKQLARFRETLESKKAELNSRIAAIKKDIGTELERDSEDQATQLENRDVLQGLANEAAVEVELINKALHRMEQGEYGTCIECGTEIDVRRLEAKPHALRCIDCASEA